jgi:uncharacterized phage protein gp47/JayE
MALSFADLLETISLDTWKSTIISIAKAVGLKTENWVEGGYTRTLVALFAQLHKTAGDVVKIIAAGGLLDTATGDWLTLLAKNVFNVPRIEATYASAAEGITLTNTGGGLFVYDAGDVIAAHSTTRKTYKSTSGGTLSPGVGQTLKLDVIAEEAGSGSSANVGTITQLVTTSLGVTVTNTVALVGVDEESDEDLRERCRESVAALSIGGIKQAYAYYAKSAVRANGTAIGVTRVRVMTPPGDGTVDVYVAGPSGAVAGADVTVIQADFDEFVTPYGFDATAISAVNLDVAPTATVWIPAALGLSEAEAQQQIADALEAYVNALPIGGTVISPATGKIYWRALLAVIGGAIGGTIKAQLASENDIDVDDDEVPVYDGGPSDFTIEQVS